MSYNDQWVKQPFRHPPLSARTKVFQMYQKKINESHHDDLMCYIDAFVLYNNTMIGLYKKYNPWLKQRYLSRRSFMPKEEDNQYYD